MTTAVVFGALALNDNASLRVADLRTVALPRIISAIEIACAKDVKRRLNAPFEDTPEGLARFSALLSNVATEEKMIAVIAVVGTDALIDRYRQVASQFLARVVTRIDDLKLVAPAPAPKAGKGGVAPLSPLSRWITAAAGLLFLVLVESIMAFYLKPATMDKATKLSLANAQAALRRDITEEDLLVNTSLIVMCRFGDFKLTFAALQDPLLTQVLFAADLVAHLPTSIKTKIATFDDAARMTLPNPSDSFEARLGVAANQPACIAQLSSWAAAVKTDSVERKAEVKKAVQQQVAALAAVPPPQGQRPAQGQRSSANHCFTCEHAGRPTTHPRETCAHYKCKGCGVVAPGHLYRNCPNPCVGGPCPPHRSN